MHIRSSAYTRFLVYRSSTKLLYQYLSLSSFHTLLLLMPVTLHSEKRMGFIFYKSLFEVPIDRPVLFYSIFWGLFRRKAAFGGA